MMARKKILTKALVLYMELLLFSGEWMVFNAFKGRLIADSFYCNGVSQVLVTNFIYEN